MSAKETLSIEIKKKKHENITLGDNRVRTIVGIGKINKDPSKSLENVYLVKGLKLNLLCVSQICDKRNNVMFNSSHCIVQNVHDDNTVLYGP